MATGFDTSIQFLKGVGPRLANILGKRGISTVGDLLNWYPRSYEDRRSARSIASLQADETVSLKAIVVQVRSYNLGKTRRKVYDVSLRDQSGVIHCKYFRTPYKGYFERFQPNQLVRVVGKVTEYRGVKEFHHPDLKDVVAEEEESDELVPIYTETEGMSPTKLRKIIATAITMSFDTTIVVEDWHRPAVEIEKIPEWLRKKYDLIGIKEALKGIHQPPKNAGKEFVDNTSIYHRRIIFEEFFWLELYLATRQSGLKKQSAAKMDDDSDKMEKIKESLPFTLTGAQEKSLNEIICDLKKGYPMHRMLQGDVGCGKTMVALLSAAHVIDSGYQVSLMVPTEILAEQHFKNAIKLLEPFGVKVGLLTGQLKVAEKREVLSKLKSGEISLCIGTHAVIQKDVEFKNLAFAIIDEQHRFGVYQRGELKNKSFNSEPHFLVMTATPIPRTLAMTVYGDLEVSIIDELPPGRQTVVTRATYDSKREKILQFLNDQVLKGRQAYIVYPLVAESEKIDLKDATSEFEKLQEKLPKIRFALLHGKMKAKEKDEVMTKFRNHEVDVLVSTTVIEVGVDVANANLIIVEHAERFGLSQLHQLRGRVGRGEHKSYCVLVLGHAFSQESKDRVQIMEKTSDGFKVAEADLEIRGPGEFLGTKQSGLPGFRLANLVRDIKILKDAREAAFEVLKKDNSLSAKEHVLLREELLENHGVAFLASIA